jgi:subtilisin family serine protease
MKKLFVLLTLLAIVVSQRAVPGEYIVVLKKNVRRNLIDSVIDLLTAGQTQRVSTRYSTAIRGFTLKGANETEVASLRRDPSVAYVEPNYIMRASALQLTTLYHLDRDDQRRRPLNLQYNYNYNGTGVTAYVVDSGYNTHDEFGNRMRHVYDATEVNGTGHDCYRYP